MDDEPNMSDAILVALSGIGWIGPLVRAGDAPPRPPKRKREYRRMPKPQGLSVPRGITWNGHNGRYCSRLEAAGGRVPVGTCAPTQEGLDALGARYEQAKALALSGATAEDIRAFLVRAAVGRGEEV